MAIEFLVDTGATDTHLHPLDARIRAAIDLATLASPESWPRRGSTRGIGGTATSYIQPAVYAFRHDDGSIQQLTREIHIAQPTVANSRLPSLLGMDILRHFRVSVDYASQQVVLT